jgi:uncharacterized NAD(P)/FAD-binding protein YdhS
MVAVHLARLAAGSNPRILLFERGKRFARGVAFGTESTHHLLNVPAGLMGALPDEPSHFLAWLQVRDPDAHAGTFAPRRVYGEYLEGLLKNAAGQDGASIELVTSEIVDLRENGAAVTLIGRDGSRIRADRAVLALGHARPGDPFHGAGALKTHPAYRVDPWAPGVLDDLGPNDPIILIGSGLSAVDLIVEARARGHRGPLTIVSRHGLLPSAHRASTHGSSPTLDLERLATPRAVLAHLRQEAARCAREGDDWRGAIDSLRPHLPGLWRSFNEAEKGRFLRHLAAVWNIHRHRVAPEINAVLEEARREGQLTVLAGRVREVESRGELAFVTLVRRGSSERETLSACRVINCTGPSRNVRDDHSPLVSALIARGLVRPDPLSLGLEVAEGGAVVNAAGAASERLFALGPLLKGQLWESTAVRELRGQAFDLARDLAAILGNRSRVRRSVA